MNGDSGIPGWGERGSIIKRFDCMSTRERFYILMYKNVAHVSSLNGVKINNMLQLQYVTVTACYSCSL